MLNAGALTCKEDPGYAETGMPRTAREPEDRSLIPLIQEAEAELARSLEQARAEAAGIVAEAEHEAAEAVARARGEIPVEIERRRREEKARLASLAEASLGKPGELTGRAERGFARAVRAVVQAVWGSA
jgi:hypothetical protein